MKTLRRVFVCIATSIILLLTSFATSVPSLADKIHNYKALEWQDLSPDFPELERLRSGASLTPVELSAVYTKIWEPSNVVPELDGQAIRMAGFIVPLEFDAEQKVIEFFLVPYHGACIHAPAPPPNQLILAKYPLGLVQQSLATSYWVSGQMSLAVGGNDLGTSGYELQVHDIGPHSD